MTSTSSECRYVFSLSVALAILLTAARPLRAQERGASRGPLPPAIEDNSFFIEEAYNQEEGVVQHISTFERLGGSVRTSEYTFTEEWPFGGPKHQLSVTMPYSWSGTGSAAGFGDALLNYRYQLTGHDDWAAFAPRLSLVLPTGREGTARPGIQVNLPASKRLNAWLVAHANAGATFLPGRDARVFNVGGSLIGLLTRNLNLMLELAATFTRERETIVSPGVRYAINVGSLQIVPGLAVPFRREGGLASTGVFAYLSFEHPFKSRREAAQVDSGQPREAGTQEGE